MGISLAILGGGIALSSIATWLKRYGSASISVEVYYRKNSLEPEFEEKTWVRGEIPLILWAIAGGILVVFGISLI